MRKAERRCAAADSGPKLWLVEGVLVAESTDGLELAWLEASTELGTAADRQRDARLHRWRNLSSDRPYHGREPLSSVGLDLQSECRIPSNCAARRALTEETDRNRARRHGFNSNRPTLEWRSSCSNLGWQTDSQQLMKLLATGVFYHSNESRNQKRTSSS